MDRRKFIQAGCAASVISLPSVESLLTTDQPFHEYQNAESPVHAIIPVVGDGKWIWRDPPKDKTGYLEPRYYDLKLGMQLLGTGPASGIRATTVAPVEFEGQSVEKFDVYTDGCRAKVRQLSPLAGQLFLNANSIQRGQVLTAVASYRMKLHKEFQNYKKEDFPQLQPEPPLPFRKQYLYDSPGIQTRSKQVRDLSKEIGKQGYHPWEKAKAFYKWVWENIEGKPQIFTSALTAIKKRVGDCEERAAVFVALCRASKIPARLVWVPNHNWAEFFLVNHDGKGSWIPAHTSAYSWFGWTGAHELTLQKGDRIFIPEKRKPQRLLADWMQWLGSRPKVRYLAELTPLAPADGGDAGPGARKKDDRGSWNRTGSHPLDAYCRDGKHSDKKPPKKLLASQSRADIR